MIPTGLPSGSMVTRLALEALPNHLSSITLAV